MSPRHTHTHEGMGRGASARTWQRMLCLGLDLEEEEAVGERDIGIKGTQAEKRPLPRPSMKKEITDIRHAGVCTCCPGSWEALAEGSRLL